ncbi:MAG TPA: choice-of-anchor tandem repeat GloVer-containing protein, partial [Candidatus Tumulicola sp.]|nr:choice-of-anchor tandem repeat GloVer-containing protein [Candidatus Tumulicola sp.]
AGGAYGSSQYGQGTVYSISTAGTEKVLHSFGAGSDGAGPWAALINVRGTLYGTTSGGGTNGGRGTVFALTP